MDYQKVDAALATAIDDLKAGSKVALAVSVRTAIPVDAAQQAELERLGVRGVIAGRTIFSASVTPQTLDELTQKPWVRRLSLAQQLRPLS